MSAPGFYLRKFLRQGRSVATLAPSSRVTARALAAHVDPSRPQVIVELGAGDGPITRHVAERMHPASRLVAVESDPEFHALLSRSVPRAEAVLGDARHIGDLLARLGAAAPDVVLNGLPTPSLPRAVNEGVFDWLASLDPETPHNQLTVMPWLFWPLYRRLFHQVRFQPVLRNLPPGGVYYCRDLRADYREHLPGH